MHSVERLLRSRGGKPMPPGSAYQSGSNTDFLTVEQLRQLIAEHVTRPRAETHDPLRPPGHHARPISTPSYR